LRRSIDGGGWFSNGTMTAKVHSGAERGCPAQYGGAKPPASTRLLAQVALHCRRQNRARATLKKARTRTKAGGALSRYAIAVLVPCYNEEKAIARVVGDFRAALPSAAIFVFDNN
jgi:hypothetical protein